MQDRFRSRKKKSTIIVVLISLAIHVLGLLLVLPFLDFDETPAKEKELQVRVVDDEAFRKIRKANKVKKKKKKKIELKKKVVEKIPPPPPEPLKKRKAVEQVTNKARPKVAAFVSDEDNKVKEETRARETKNLPKPSNTEKKSSPKEERKEKQENERQVSKSGEIVNPDTKKPKPIEGLVRKNKPEKSLGNPFQKPSLHEAENVLAKPGFSPRKMESLEGRKFMKNYEKNDRALKASLKNFIPEIKPGNHTGVNAHKNSAASYLSHIHRKIHPLWADNFLIKLDLYDSMDSELSNPSLGTKLEFVIDGKSGEVEKINIVKSSGALRFDAEAISIGHQVGPHKKAPRAIVSSNGKVYIHWNFWRNQRQCGTFGASVFLLDKDA